MERLDYFKNYKKHARDIKKIVSKYLDKFDIYVFGSVIRGDYSVGLSDVDIAVVSDEFKSREKKLEVYDVLLERYFDSPFEFHLLTSKQWNFFLRFIGKDLIKI